MNDDEPRLTHLNEAGEAHMVDVGDKTPARRRAIASGLIRMDRRTLEMIADGAHPKGDVFAVARVAGIMAAKRASETVPLCHPLALSRVAVDLGTDREINAVVVHATAETTGPTGVEIEALAAVQATLLTVYDMCKAVDRGMVIDQVRLEHKSGGRSGTWERTRQA
ncbi:MAG: cyclic pyranopterin monophosphate synthase MoaC [Chromatiales bacterium]|nr:cyclic pyranopterin monophosphate synthase MoaC [Chromatiales bacterium]